MFECEVCGEKDFTIIDGSFYCTQCNTRSQHAVEETLDDDINGVNLMSGYGTDIKRTKKRLGDKEEKTGRYWQTFELWTIVIKKQVEALVALGASRQLEEFVLRIWMLYLRKLNVAFSTSTAPLLAKNRVRDRKVGEPKLYKPRRKFLDNNDSALSENEDLEFYPGDNPFASDDEDETQFLPDAKNLKNKREYYNVFEVNRMTKPKTLAFCYLGLLYTKSLVTWAEIFHWVQQGKVPYYNILDLLPSDIKLGVCDSSCFTNEQSHSNLSVVKMHHCCGILAQYLQLENLPTPNILQFCSKLIVQMDLPTQMHRLAAIVWKRFAKQLNPTHSYLILLLPECHLDHQKRQMTTEIELLAMALVVLIIKMLYTLDDKYEKQVDRQAEEMKCHSCDGQPFELHKWLRHTQQHQRLNKNTFTISSANVDQIVDVDNYVRNHVEIFCGYSSDKMAPSVTVRSSYRDENRFNIVKPVAELADDLSERAKRQAQQQHLLFADEEEENDHNALINFLGAAEPTKKTIKKVNQEQVFANTKLDHIIKATHIPDTTPDEESISNSFESEDLQIPPFVPLPKKYNVKDLSLSYSWLLCICSKVIGWHESDLHTYVRLLELILVKDRNIKRHTKADRQMLHLFFRHYTHCNDSVLEPTSVIKESVDIE